MSLFTESQEKQLTCVLFEGTLMTPFTASQATEVLVSHGYRPPRHSLVEDYRQLVKDLDEIVNKAPDRTSTKSLAEALLEYGWRR